MLNQILSTVLLILGEALCVYAEMVAAQSHSVDPSAGVTTFLKNFGLIAVAGGLLIGGYMLGYVAFRNIWIVSVISVTSILLVEPGLTYFVFQELPHRGAVVGMVLGGLGFVATLVL